MSRSIETGTTLFSKWMVTATYALWFGEVHASVAKLRAPTCSFFYIFNFIEAKIMTLLTCNIFAMHLQTLTNTFLTSIETVLVKGWGIQAALFS